jgi:ribosomal-protein-alanine acetyltransferase
VITVRKFKPTDMFAVIKLASDTLTERYNPSLFNYFYETFPEGFIVAEKAHKIVGFVIGVKIKSNTAKILMISVSEQHRKQKIGSTLLAQFLKEITSKKIKHIELEVRTNNKKAIKFYQKYKFKIIEKLKEFYQTGEDAYTMRYDF